MKGISFQLAQGRPGSGVLRKLLRSVLGRAIGKVSALVASGTMLSVSAASATQYYYDALGRQIGSFRPAAQAEEFQFDAADNRGLLNAFGIVNPAQPGILNPNQSLLEGQSLSSPDGQFMLTFQQNGDLVLLQGGTQIWDSQTSNKVASRVCMLPTGDLIMYDPQDNEVWHTNTNGHSGAQLFVQNGGGLYVSYQGTTIWTGH